ncbi:MAG: 2-amino-4-hydroxy-6-hydroxymethyldihydropteridine diphosphokinase [Chromatiales bacterium]|nr:2-amino-4-hydroxy-6-hydroxymethyldihydropteridine diphosphokinase [Gammaproteobacteria bacterium]MBW6476584.1 2-amino-4-hydroxy-6-hydroxymethyldihydropteridine diphosphokinase [Chromatiales bacterium]
MARVYLSIGSNIEPETHIRSGVSALRAQFGQVELSSVYESAAVGFDGDNFYNLVAAIQTNMSLAELAEQLRAIEDAHDRSRAGPRFSSRTLDIDILLYDDLVINEGKLVLPREEITKNAFVLWPLAEVAPTLQHPVLKQSYAELWAAYDKDSQPLWPVEFDFG